MTRFLQLVLLSLVMVGSIALAARADADDREVHPVDWSHFDRDTEPTETMKLVERYILNAARYHAHRVGGRFELDRDKNQFRIPNQNTPAAIRRPSSVALGLAVALRTGIYDAQTVDLSRGELRQRLVRLIKGVAACHKVNGGKWGDHWQSALWAGLLGRAGWMMWRDLGPTAQNMLRKLITYEADSFLREDYSVPYWNGKGGDSEAEENSWDSMVLTLASTMMPEHPNSHAWRRHASQLMVSAYSRPSDRKRRGVVIDGRTPEAWLDGYNIRQDGVVINHGLIHNDYITAIAHCQMSAYPVRVLARKPVPQSADFNFDVLWRTLTQRHFEAPPHDLPGGTMYRDDSPEQYYPEGTDWSRHRYACFALMDCYAYLLGDDEAHRRQAKRWMTLRTKRMLAMQSRHSDGHTYAEGEFNNFGGAEQMVFWFMSDLYLVLWLDEQSRIDDEANWLSAAK
jgi:hypothetical protein